MLQYLSAFSSFSATNLDQIEKFYRDSLGLKVTSEMPGTLQLSLQGGQTVFIYGKDNHQPATYTVLNLVVENIDEAVDVLVSAGVKMEKYEGLGQDEKGISRGEGVQGPTGIAWFKDPAGNILAVIEE